MKTFAQFIAEAELGGTKQTKLSALKDISTVAKSLIVSALDPYQVFGVKKFIAPTSYAGSDPDEGELFVELLKVLAAKKLTGNAARDAVTEVLGKYTEPTAALLTRVLNKDLKCGIQTLVNKVYPDLVPSFEVMLAKKLEPGDSVQFPVIASTKCDGERTIAICENGVVNYYSRSGKEATHVNGLFDDDMRKIEQYLGYPVVIDGERYAGNFTRTMNAKKSGNDAAKSDLKLMAFDYMSLDNWKKQLCIVSQRTREGALNQILTEFLKLEKIVMMPSVVVDNQLDLMNTYTQAVSLGFEGLIIKNPDGYYEWSRSKNWLKMKPIIDVDLAITGVYEGSKGSKYEGMMGGLMCQGYDENGKFIQTDVGSGFSDEQRKEMWENSAELIGKTVMLQCQEISKAENSESYSLRFPVFLKLRDDK